MNLFLRFCVKIFIEYTHAHANALKITTIKSCFLSTMFKSCTTILFIVLKVFIQSTANICGFISYFATNLIIFSDYSIFLVVIQRLFYYHIKNINGYIISLELIYI